MEQANDLKIYRDGDRYIIGRAAWQTCMSMTYGVAETYSRRGARQVASELSNKPLADIEAMKQTFWTDERFEQGCDDGLFGAAWN